MNIQAFLFIFNFYTSSGHHKFLKSPISKCQGLSYLVGADHMNITYDNNCKKKLLVSWAGFRYLFQALSRLKPFLIWSFQALAKFASDKQVVWRAFEQSKARAWHIYPWYCKSNSNFNGFIFPLHHLDNAKILYNWLHW